MPINYLNEVRNQYEELPYPPRDPEDDKKRLVTTWLDELQMLNQYCFQGRENFSNGFRALFAGGGTGDGTIYLAEQLKGTDAEIVHLDFSEASIEIAKRRAAIRSLDNITWVHDSLLNAPLLGLGEFNYINCSGVLHHLQNPDAGLKALISCLAPKGALGLMVYGKHARAGVYQMQELLKLANKGITDSRTKVAVATELLSALPKSNLFLRCSEMFSDIRHGPAGVFDLLLHPQDRAYSVGELHEWITDTHGLHIAFTDVGRGSAVYSPELLLGNVELVSMENIRNLSQRKKEEAAELITGTLITHSFFVTRDVDAAAPYGDADFIPFFFHEAVTGPQMAKVIENNRGSVLHLNHSIAGVTAYLKIGKFTKYIFNNLDGKRTFGEIFDIVRSIPKLRDTPPSNNELFDDFWEFYTFFRALDRIFLAHRACVLET